MKEHLDKFDLLRGIAIILVVGYHIMACLFENYELANYTEFFVSTSNISNDQILLNLFPFAFGNNGVVLFLIISGFLIHYNYILKDKAFNASLFYNKRFWRIYPPYLVALLLFGCIIGTAKNDWLYHLFLVHNTRNAYIYSINPSFWSLALEVQLYLIYPAYLYMYRRYGNSTSFIITVAVSLFCISLRIIFDIEKVTFYTSVFNYWAIWTIGAFFAHIYHYKQRISKISYGGLIFIMMILIALRLTIVHQYFSPYLFAVFFILLIDKLLHTELKENNFYKLLKVIGLCSYSIYLFHQPVLSFFKDVIFKQYQLSLSIQFIILIIACIVITLISYLSYRTLEVQSIKAGNRFYKRFFTPGQNVK